jgi:hypothetical protein
MQEKVTPTIAILLSAVILTILAFTGLHFALNMGARDAADPVGGVPPQTSLIPVSATSQTLPVRSGR